ncbi:MAG: hypothetical protein WDW38_008114 [Sanguina aurantia]
MESVRGLTECIELLFGESIVARDEATVILSAGRGLGPPDLCWLQKATVSALTGAKAGEPGGYYHHALGRDVSSSAAVAAYFASITMRVEAVPWMRGASQAHLQHGVHESRTAPAYEPLPTPEDERRLLGHILEMYRSKVLPQGLELLTEDSSIIQTS